MKMVIAVIQFVKDTGSFKLKATEDVAVTSYEYA